MENTSAGQPVSLSGIGAIQTADQSTQASDREVTRSSTEEAVQLTMTAADTDATDTEGVPVPLPTDVGSTNNTDSNLEAGPGFYIQAGVFADVDDAEKVAVNVVLTVPLEEVHVKPLKGSEMYRITVGPIVAADHAAEVSGKLDDAGLENFTVKVKSIQ